MFSLQLHDELGFATPTTTNHPYQIPQDLIIDNNPIPIPMLENNLISFSSTTSNTQTKNSGRSKGRSCRHGSYDDKRVMHRDIERKRREQISKLYASLSALLPVENNKGKRSVSDQMEEAANYIKQMHNKIQQLTTRRDSLKKLHNPSSSSCATNIQNSEGGNAFRNRVSMHRVSDGMEIHITKENPEFELSQVLAQLSKRELDVVSCVSARTKAGFLHKIDITGSDMMSLDDLELQNKLTEAINYNEKQPSSRSSRQRQTDQSKYGSNDKRVVHRDIERRRRQQMSKLYASLSSLLPNKERSSSVCDQMEEAANYIKQMHKNIEELQTRRDNLKKLNISSSQGRRVENSDGSDNCVAIHEVMDGLEILFSSERPEFEPSRVLSELVERDLDVVSCVSTRSKGGYLHKFEIKALDTMNLDVSELHDKLIDAIKF